MNPETVDMLRKIFVAVAPICAMGAAITAVVFAFSGSSNIPQGKTQGYKEQRLQLQNQFAFTMGLLFVGLSVGSIAIEYLLARSA
jgi:hypothetical protein